MIAGSIGHGQRHTPSKDGVERSRIRRFITKPSDLEEFMKIGFIVKELLAESGH